MNTRSTRALAKIFFLDLGGGRVLSANPDGTDLKTLLIEGRKLPDGLAVDAAAGHLYWTNMGNPKVNDGSILRSDLDGGNVTTVIAPGGTFTAKQLQIAADTAHVLPVVVGMQRRGHQQAGGNQRLNRIPVVVERAAGAM